MDIPMDSLVSPVPFICSLSKKVRAGLQVLDLNEDGMRRAVVGVIKQVEEVPGLKESLQEKVPGGKLMRRIDLRFSADGPIQFKSFVSWNWTYNCWHVFVEGPNETCFEDGELNW